jgi:hypothetical protein
MRNRRGTSPAMRQLTLALVVAVGGAILGTLVAPTPAAATETKEVSGWTCQGTDRCHAGSSECCEDPDTVEELTHCTTICA